MNVNRPEARSRGRAGREPLAPDGKDPHIGWRRRAASPPVRRIVKRRPEGVSHATAQCASGARLHRSLRHRPSHRLSERELGRLCDERHHRDRELHRRLDPRQCGQGRQSVGAGRRPAARPVSQARRAGAVLHHSDPRHGPLPDRHPRHHQHLQGGKDDDARHRAGRRRRGPVLEGDRPAEGGARRRRLRRRRSTGPRRRRCAT